VFAFGATYEAEMNKLPGEASEMTREAKHRELLGLDDERVPHWGGGVSDQATEEERSVDVLALLSDARRPTPEASL
jgi:hypothetical protein